MSDLDSNFSVYAVQISVCTDLFLLAERLEAEKNLNYLFLLNKWLKERKEKHLPNTGLETAMEY